MCAAVHQVLVSPAGREYLKRCLEEGKQEIPACQATLKMSGHLILARGVGGRLIFSAKNSADNAFTAAAELLLSELLGGDAGLQRLAQGLEAAKACASFECITSFSGDHGYPERAGVDVLVCTAIHTLAKGASVPWTQVEVFKFTLEHGLVCAQSLLALDAEASGAVFAEYNLLRHQFGPHSKQVENFFKASAAHGSSERVVALQCLPHKLVSDIVEGFVVRSVALSAKEAAALLELAERLDATPARPIQLTDGVRRGVSQMLETLAAEESSKSKPAAKDRPRRYGHVLTERAVMALLKQRSSRGGSSAAGAVLRPVQTGSCSVSVRVREEAPAWRGGGGRHHSSASAEGPEAVTGETAVADEKDYMSDVGPEEEGVEVQLEAEGEGVDAASPLNGRSRGGSGSSAGGRKGAREPGPGATLLLQRLLAAPADDPATRFVVGVLQACRRLRVKAKLSHYVVQVPPPPPPLPPQQSQAEPVPPAAAAAAAEEAQQLELQRRQSSGASVATTESGDGEQGQDKPRGKKKNFWKEKHAKQKTRKLAAQQLAAQAAQQQQGQEGAAAEHQGGDESGAVPAETAATNAMDLFILHTFHDQDQYKFHRHAEQHPEAGVLYRGFVIRVWEDSCGGGSKGRKGGGDAPLMRAEVFMNFYPKFDNAKQQEADKMTQDLWPAGGGPITTGGIKKFKFSYYMYLTMLCRAVVGSICGANAAKKSLTRGEWLNMCESRLTLWGMTKLQQVPYMRRLRGWWAYLSAAQDRGEQMDAFGFLSAFQEFLSQETHWCDSVAGGGAGARGDDVAAVQAAMEGLSRSSGESRMSRPIFFIVGGRATRHYAAALATLLGIPIITSHAKAQRGPQALSDGRFPGSVVVLNPAALGAPEPSAQQQGAAGDAAQQEPAAHISLCKNMAFPPAALFVVDTAAAEEALADIAASKGKGKGKKGGGGEGAGFFPVLQWVERARECGCRVVDVSEGPAAPPARAISDALLEEESKRLVPLLVVPLGFLGTGKSSISNELQLQLGATIVSSERLETQKDGSKRPHRLKGPEFELALKAALQPQYQSGGAQQLASLAPAATSTATAATAAAAAAAAADAAAALEASKGKSRKKRKGKKGAPAPDNGAADGAADAHPSSRSASDSTDESGGKPTVVEAAAAQAHSGEGAAAPAPARVPIVVRDKNIPKDDLWKAVTGARPSSAVALAFGGCARAFGGDAAAAEAALGAVPPVTPWELAVCMWRVMQRREHPSISAEADITPGLVCQFASRLAGGSYCTVEPDGTLCGVSYTRSQWLSDVAATFGGAKRVIGLPICRTAQYCSPPPQPLAALLEMGMGACGGFKMRDEDFAAAMDVTGVRALMIGGASKSGKTDKAVGAWQAKWAAAIRAAVQAADAQLRAMAYDKGDEDFKAMLNDAVQDIANLATEAARPPDTQPPATTAAAPAAAANAADAPPPPPRAAPAAPVTRGAPPPKLSAADGAYYYAVAVAAADIAAALGASALALGQGWLSDRWHLAWPGDAGGSGGGGAGTRHVTLLYIGSNGPAPEDADVLETLHSLLGQPVEVSVLGVASDGKAAALVVTDMRVARTAGSAAGAVVPCRNACAHVTLCTAPGVMPRHSNDMLEGGRYEVLELRGYTRPAPPLVLAGTVAAFQRGARKG